MLNSETRRDAELSNNQAPASDAAQPGSARGKTARGWVMELWVLWVLLGVFFADQATKYLIRTNMYLGQSIPQDGIFRITYTYNTGAAFGLFPNQTFLLVLASLLGIGVLLVFYRHQPFPGLLLQTSLGLQLGGAVGNLVDRLTQGRVVDFVDLGFWPVFNMADASIVVGIVLLAWMFLTTGGRQRKAETRGDAQAPPSAPPAQGDIQSPLE